MNSLCEQSVEFLMAVCRQQEGLFPYSTHLKHGKYVNDFNYVGSTRYSINSLLGLQEATKHAPTNPLLANVDEIVDVFFERQYYRVTNPGDLGLLSLLLRDSDQNRMEDILKRISDIIAEQKYTDFNMQELAWILWGASVAAQQGVKGASSIAQAVFQAMVENFVHPNSQLPRHSCHRYRRQLVSFGSLTYFLRSVYEFGTFADDDLAMRLFQRGVETIISLQGPYGEWPWLLNARSADVVDAYPIFTVHQDSMSMLFLLPALGSGISGVEEAVAKSYEWMLGRNEIGRPMIATNPFCAYRSLERREPFPRSLRYGRALAYGLGASGSGGFVTKKGVRVNRECRSYHLGWLLYVWSGRNDAPTLER